MRKKRNRHVVKIKVIGKDLILSFGIYFFNSTTRTMPMPMMTTGLDNRFPVDDATPCTVFAAELATEPIVLQVVLATAPIELVTDPTNCPGIAMILFKSPPVVLII